jgi:hypothetical protein
MTQASLTGPTSYTTGGIAYTPQNFGLDYNVDAVVISSCSGGLIAIWDRANKKIKLFYPTGGASAPSTVTAPVAAAPALSGAPAIGTLAAAAPAIGTHAGTVTPDAGSTTMTGSAAKPTLSVTFSGALAAPVLSGAPAIGTLAAAAPALTGGQGIEVAASTDVSSIVIETIAFGF